eukprot:2834640-Lingulodinium_polyedra.AAC.1
MRFPHATTEIARNSHSARHAGPPTTASKGLKSSGVISEAHHSLGTPAMNRMPIRPNGEAS